MAGDWPIHKIWTWDIMGLHVHFGNTWPFWYIFMLQSWALSLKACDLPRGRTRLISADEIIVGCEIMKKWWTNMKHDGRNKWNRSQTFLGKKMNGTPNSCHSCRITSQAPLILIGRQGTQRPLHCGKSDNLINWAVQLVQQNIHRKPDLVFIFEHRGVLFWILVTSPWTSRDLLCGHVRNPHQRTAGVLLKELQEWPRLVDLGESKCSCLQQLSVMWV